MFAWDSFFQCLRNSQSAVTTLIEMIAGPTDKAKPATKVFFHLAPVSSLPENIKFNLSEPTLREAVTSLVQQCLSQDKLQKKFALGALAFIMEKCPVVKHSIAENPQFLQLCSNGLGSVDQEVRYSFITFQTTNQPNNPNIGKTPHCRPFIS